MRKYKVLFPDYLQYPRRKGLRKYVKDVLCELARNKELYVTDLLNQPNNPICFRDLCGEVVFGVEIIDEAQTHADIPEELASYRVKLRPYGIGVDGQPRKSIRWKKGRYAIEDWYGAGSQVQLYEDVFADMRPGKDGVVSVSLQDAWNALRQYGKDCRWAKKERQKQDVWRIEEVQQTANRS